MIAMTTRVGTRNTRRFKQPPSDPYPAFKSLMLNNRTERSARRTALDLTRKGACLIGEDCFSSFEGACNQDPICPVESGVTPRKAIVGIGLVVSTQLRNHTPRTIPYTPTPHLTPLTP